MTTGPVTLGTSPGLAIALCSAFAGLGCAPPPAPPRAPTVDVAPGEPRDGVVEGDGEGEGLRAGSASEADARPLPSSPEGRARTAVVDLPVEGFFPAVLHVPAGDGPRPLVVGAHGAYDRADSFCRVVASAVRGSAYVLCPRGKRTDARAEHAEASYFFPTHLWLEAEIAAGIEALGRAHGRRVDPARAVYVGFSQGAIMGALVVPRHPAQFPRAMLIEGSYGLGRWNVETGARFRRGGGERIAFVCGGWFCADQARTSALTIAGPGARTEVVRAAGGHTYGGDVARAIEATFPWLVDGDPRFADP